MRGNHVDFKSHSSWALAHNHLQVCWRLARVHHVSINLPQRVKFYIAYQVQDHLDKTAPSTKLADDTKELRTLQGMGEG
jgi:hypothetical protein